MKIKDMQELKSLLGDIGKHRCTVIIAKYNAGKSSSATDILHEHFGEENTCYITFIDQSKPDFTPRKSKLKFGEQVKNKVIVFDELSDDKNRDVRNYAKKLTLKNRVIILSNPYGSSQDAVKEIQLFKETEADIVPEDTLFVFVESI